MRIADILKNKSSVTDGNTGSATKENVVITKPTEEVDNDKMTRNVIPETSQKFQIDNIIAKNTTIQIPKEVKVETADPIEAYTSLTNWIKNILFNMTDYSVLHEDMIIEVLNKLVKLNSGKLLLIVNKSTTHNYLIGHSANVCILALKFGRELNYDQDKLLKLGAVALLHDIGMFKMLDIVNKPGKLSAEEYTEIKKHALLGKNIVENIDITENFKKVLIPVVFQHHERKNGKGYPSGVKEISEFAKIISLIDIYEALTHYRPYRERLLPHNALKFLIEQCNEFDTDLIKILIKAMSLFPPGSFIKLNTGEIAKVVSVHSEFPTRPVVELFMDSQSNILSEKKIIDLSATPMVHISEAIDELKLKVSKEVAFKLKSQLYWI
ncbi:MAG: HD domain-containing phosphohydrolase [Candidatus Firestonebacteria bacterium]